MRILITGCNGLLGQNLVRLAPAGAEVAGLDLAATSLPAVSEYFSVDLGERKQVLAAVSEWQPQWILNAAAFTDVDGAETQRELCWRVNVAAVENLVYACRKVPAAIAHVSTDYIFDGNHGPYREEDPPNPIGYYGRSKLAGENVLTASEVPHAIARTMVLYGYGLSVRPNFVTWLIAKLQKGEGVRIVTDQLGNATLADELALALWRMVEVNASGTFHIAGRDVISRYDFAMAIARVFALDPSLITAITTDQLKQAAPRPMKSGLVVEKAIRELGVRLSGAEEGLRFFKNVLDAAHPA
jgi:dTDP-4-dehydrorhamnose reductase